jgi:hypothetical protein
MKEVKAMSNELLLLVFIAIGIFLLVFLGILGLCLKLYTEYFKAEDQKKRKGEKNGGMERKDF